MLLVRKLWYFSDMNQVFLTWPDPLDHYFWMQIKAKCERHHNSVTALNEDIKKAVRSLEMAEIIHVVLKFGKRVEDLTMAEGGHIE